MRRDAACLGMLNGGQTRRRPQSGLFVAADGREPGMCLLLLLLLVLLLSGGLLATGFPLHRLALQHDERSVFTYAHIHNRDRGTQTLDTTTHKHTRARTSHTAKATVFWPTKPARNLGPLLRGQPVGCRLPFGWLPRPPFTRPPSHTVAHAHRKARMGAKMFTIFEQQTC